MGKNDSRIKNQRIRLLRELCKKLEVSYPPELASELVKEDNKPLKPPKKEMDVMIRETKNLIKEDNNIYHFEIPKLGIILYVKIWWEEDKFATFKIFDISPMKKYKNVCTDFLFKQVGKYSNYERILEDLWDEYEEKITSSKEFKSIDSRIIKVCDKTDEWEREYKDFEFDYDILTPAGG